MPDSVTAVQIREEQAYDGVRVTLLGTLWQARIPLQIDIGFGDAVTPPPEKVDFPTLLDAPIPQLLTYSRYTMVAEKVETMLRLGMANSRMKDFYDIWLLKELFLFDGLMLCKALNNTLQRRETQLPDKTPIVFTEEFSRNSQKLMQWRTFIKKAKPEEVSEDLDVIIVAISAFLMPVVKAVQANQLFDQDWPPGGPWKDRVS